MAKVLKRVISRVSSEPEQPGKKITVFVYRDADCKNKLEEVLNFTEDDEYTASNVVHRLVARLNISTRSFYLFGLTTLADCSFVICPKKPLESEKYVLRVVYHPDASRLFDLGEEALHYYICQCRYDIVHHVKPNLHNVMVKEGVTTKEGRKNPEIDFLMTIWVFDALRFCRRNFPNENSREQLKRLDRECFVPKKYGTKLITGSVKDGFEQDFIKYAEHADYKKRGAIELTWFTCARGLYMLYPDLNTYRFELRTGETLLLKNSSDVLTTKGGLYAEYKKDRNEQETILIAKYSDITEISIENETKFRIFRNDRSPREIEFDSVERANVFLVLLDGYKRLTSQWYQCFFKQFTCPVVESLANMDYVRCHGPLRPEFAWQCLRERHRHRQTCNFLLLQSNGSLEQYCLLVLHDEESLPPYTISRDNGGKYFVDVPKLDTQPHFDKIGDLIRHYKQTPLPGGPKLQIPVLPGTKSDPCLYLCGPKPSDELSATSPADSLDQEVVSTVKFVRKVEFDNEIKMKRTEDSYTVFNVGKFGANRVGVKQMHLAEVQETDYLLEMAQDISMWKNRKHLVELLALCCVGPTKVILEYAPKGCLLEFFRQAHFTVSVRLKHILQAAQNLAYAMNYLEENCFLHGNVCCANMLVFEHTREALVAKLGDPGLVKLDHKQPLYHKRNLKRIPWLAPELLSDDVTEFLTHEADRYATAVTVWEMFHLGQEPYHGLSPEQKMEVAKEGKQADYLRQGHEPKDVYAELCKSWSSDVTKRAAPQDLIRVLRLLLLDVNTTVQNGPYMDISHDDYTDGDGRNEGLNLVLLRTEARRPQQAADTEGATGGAMANGDVDVNGHVLGKEYYIPRKNFVPQSFHKTDVHPLGQGYYGTVYKATLVLHNESMTNIPVALKILNKEKISRFKKEFEDEFLRMVKLKHENIVAVKGHSLEGAIFPPYQYMATFVCLDTQLILVMEYCDHGSIKSYIMSQSRPIAEERFLDWTKQLATGMNYLHEQRCVHRDLAARNILMTANMTVKVGDFGLARVLGQEQNYYTARKEAEIPYKWSAPESIDRHKFDNKTDVWSFGVVVWELFSYGKIPKLGKDARSQYQAIVKGQRLQKPDMNDDLFEMLCLHCWDYFPENRPVFTDILTDLQRYKLSTMATV